MSAFETPLLDILVKHIECSKCPCFRQCEEQKPKSCKVMIAQKMIDEIQNVLYAEMERMLRG